MKMDSSSTRNENRASAAYRLKLISDRTPDISSLEAVVDGAKGMAGDDEARCEILRHLVWQSRFNSPDRPPADHLARDPVLLLNSFPGTICSQDAAVLSAFWIAAGYDARAYELGWHTTAEAYYGGAWHNFDPTLWETNRLRATIIRDGRPIVAGVEERTDDWRKPFGKPQRWDEFDAGHAMELNLRRGESFTRYWHPRGRSRDYQRLSNGQPPSDTRDRMHWAFDLFPRPFAQPPRDAPYANGEFEFEPALAPPHRPALAESEVDIAESAAPGGVAAIGPTRPGKRAAIVFKVASPYIISGGVLDLAYTRVSQADILEVGISTDNGARWTNVWRAAQRGAAVETVTLSQAVGGTVGYLIRFEMQAADAAADVRIERIKLKTIVMLNPFLLPALVNGRNELRLTAGSQTESVFVQPNLADPSCAAHFYSASNVSVRHAPEVPEWAAGLHAQTPGTPSEIVCKIETPGDICGAEWGGNFVTLRSDRRPEMAAGCSNEMAYSYDGRTWISQPWTYRYAVRTPHGEKLREMHLERVAEIPTGRRAMYFRYRFLRQRADGWEERLQEQLLASLRIRVDHAVRRAAAIPPVEVTYCWDEERGEKRHTHVVRSLPDAWNLEVPGAKMPVMKWVRLRIPGE